MGASSRAHSIIGYYPEGRPENDFYPTPDIATHALMQAEIFRGPIWEPACGDGAISKILENNYGYKVFSTDIEPRNYGTQQDFLCAEKLPETNFDIVNIITNPPFKIIQKFAEHALELGCEKLALFGKLAFLEGQERTLWLEKTPFKCAYVFRKRLSLYRNGVKMKNGGMIAFAWFVWERGHTAEPVIRWV